MTMSATTYSQRVGASVVTVDCFEASHRASRLRLVVPFALNLTHSLHHSHKDNNTNNMEQQHIIQQLQDHNTHLQQQLQQYQQDVNPSEEQHQQVQHQQSQLIQELQQQLQQQGNALPAEEQQIEEEQEEPPVLPPQLPLTSQEMRTACDGGDVAKIICLIEAGENTNSANVYGYTPIMFAIMYGKISPVKVLFGFGADLSIVTGSGSSVIHIAADFDTEEAIKWLLINSTIDINLTDNYSTTAVHFAMLDRHLNTVMLLFERGALLSIADDIGMNLLHIAAKYCDVKAINWVLDNSTLDINSANGSGNTPMTLALLWGRLASAKLLIERGANLFMKDNNGERFIDVRSMNPSGAALLGPQVLLHAKELRWAAIKEFILLSKACQSPHRRVTTDMALSMDDDDATILSRFRSIRLTASIFAIPGLLRHIGSYIIRSDIIVRDKSIPKPPDAVKLRVEATLKAAANKKRGRSTK
jgi:hypothetical protein